MSEPLLNLVINDTHCGSEYGLLPKQVYMEDGRSIGYANNKRLEFLWKSWRDMEKRFAELADGDPYILTLNGDLIEGIHHRSDEVVAAKLSQHLLIAKACLSGLVLRAKKVIVTRGTQCHTQDWEGFFCKEFGLPPAKDVQQYTVNGCLVDARHHMATATNIIQESAALSKVIVATQANCVRVRHPVPRVLLRGHRHLTGDFCDGDNMIIVPGSWQFMTRHAHKVATESSPRFSAYALDWRHSKKGDLPARHCFRYNPPYELMNA